MSLVINNLAIEVVKKQVKNLNLSVHAPDGRVKLSVPHHIKGDEIRSFVTSKLPWIRKQQRKIEQRIPRDSVAPPEYIDVESHFFIGEKYPLKVVEEPTEKQRMEIDENREMVMFVQPGKDRTIRLKIMKEFYRATLKQMIPVLVAKWEPIMGVKVQEWGVKQMKTRWGTCNPKERRVWLNLELGKHSAGCLEYIVVHEMIHLMERKHSQRFYQLMDEFLPDWKERKEELSESLYQ